MDYPELFYKIAQGAYRLILHFDWTITFLVVVVSFVLLMRIPAIQPLISDLIGRLRKLNVTGYVESEFDPQKKTEPEPEDKAQDNIQKAVLVKEEKTDEEDAIAEEVGEYDPGADSENDEVSSLQKAWRHFFKKEYEPAKAILDEVIKTTDSEDEKCEAKVIRLVINRKLGKGNYIEELQALTEEFDNHFLPFNSLGFAYSQVKDYDKSVSAFLEASKRADAENKVGILISAAEVMQEKGDLEKAYDFLKEHIGDCHNNKDKANILKELGNICAKKKNPEEMYGYYEKSLEINPEDDTLRFKLAMQYSENKQHELSLYHYKISRQDNGVLNNSGVEYKALGMPLRSIKYYKAAFDDCNSLSGSNLAHELMDAGFLTEAKEILEKASQYEDVSPAVHSAKSRLGKLSEDDGEQAKEDRVLATAEKRKTIRIEYNEALTDDEVVIPVGMWKSSTLSGDIYITISQSDETVEGVIYRKANHLLGNFTTTELYSFSGSVEGRAMKIHTQYEKKPGLSLREAYSQRTKKGTGYLTISSDTNQIDGYILDFPDEGGFEMVETEMCSPNETIKMAKTINDYASED